MKKLLILLMAMMFAHPALASVKYPAPVLVNPQVYETGQGVTVTKIPIDQDAIVKLPTVKKVGSTFIQGGHNVVIIGGSITIPKSDTLQRAIYINGATGTVHIEGIEVTCTPGVYFDAIAINAPLAVVQIQKTRLCSDGRQNIFHGDLVQPWGGVKELYIDNMTGFAGYQGLQLPDTERHGMGPVFLSHIDLHSTGKQVTTDGGNGGFLLWTTIGSSGCSEPITITMSDVWLEGRVGRSPGQVAWPSSTKPSACKSKVVGNVISFSTTLPIKGTATAGKPAAEYVPLGKAGLTYKP